MHTSLLFGYVGPIMLATGFGFLFAGVEYMKEMQQSILKNPGVLFLTGILTTLMGLSIIGINNISETGFEFKLMEFIGWAALIKGLFMLAFPKTMMVLSEKVTNKNFYQFGMFAWLLVGFWFTWGHYIGF